MITNPMLVGKEKENNLLNSTTKNSNANNSLDTNLRRNSKYENYENENGETIPPFLMVISLADMKFEYIEPLSLGSNFKQYSPYEKLEKGSKRNIESMKRRISYNSVDLDSNNSVLLTTKIAAINSLNNSNINNALNNQLFSNLNSNINSRDSTFGNFENFYENVTSAEKIFRPEILPSVVNTNCEKNKDNDDENNMNNHDINDLLLQSRLFPEDANNVRILQIVKNIFERLFYLFL